MDDQIFDRIHEVDLKKTMETSYIDYAMSVIAARALPDARDGLKPVQRRILYSMIELNNGPDKPHRKSARIVGDTMGKYHPHGDSSIYGALVNMAQDWNMRYILVDGHGNFGSMDGDGAAAMRYTEARLSKISMEMLADINKDTVDFVPNFDDTEKEPVVLPSRYPNLLVNGATGIAVGMATNIPPHNLREIVAAVVKIIDNYVEEDRKTTIEEVLQIVKAPDFPTGATILGTRGIEQAYRTGRAKLKVRAVTEIETLPSGKSQIIVTELPYMVNKANLIVKMADLVKAKKIEGITAIRDESNREGIRVVIEVRKDANANVILNQLYRHTQLQDTFGVIMLALTDNNQPKVMNLLEMLQVYLKHQEDVVTRRTRYDLNKAEERDHILQGLLMALDYIDEVINIIRSSENVNAAKARLIERFGFSDAQAQAIVDMRLRALTGLERDKLESEHEDLQTKISYYKALLSDKKLLYGVIKQEINTIAEKYGDDRRTKVVFDDFEFNTEDFVPLNDTVLAMTHLGYIKRMTMDNFKAQNRGGRGIKGMSTIEDDYIVNLVMTTTHSDLMMYTNFGRVYKMKTYEIPEASRTARGTAIINLLQLSAGEKISAIVPVDEYNDKYQLIMATKNGLVKKTPVTAYSNIRKSGLIAINLREGDELIGVDVANEDTHILLVTKKGMCIRFGQSDVRATGRDSMGVTGIRLGAGDKVVGMQTDEMGEKLLIASEKGLGKLTDINMFNAQNRGGKGVKCYKITEKTGDVMGIMAVNDNDEIMMITTEGVIIQIRVSDISTLGRITSGVKLMNLDEGVSVAQMTKIRRTVEEESESGNLEDLDDPDELSKVKSDGSDLDYEPEERSDEYDDPDEE
ncbi:MAG: DNA gyrase subunit A [Lachnospiraceae bacterium]|nr:DNA gyrase subunit A [Lachnospiraceae bacterium]